MFGFRRVDDYHQTVANENGPPTLTVMSFAEFCAFVRAQRQAALEARAERVAGARKLFLQYAQGMDALGFHAISQQELHSMERELAFQHEMNHDLADHDSLQPAYSMYRRDTIQNGSLEES